MASKCQKALLPADSGARAKSVVGFAWVALMDDRIEGGGCIDLRWVSNFS